MSEKFQEYKLQVRVLDRDEFKRVMDAFDPFREDIDYVARIINERTLEPSIIFAIVAKSRTGFRPHYMAPLEMIEDLKAVSRDKNQSCLSSMEERPAVDRET